MDEDFGASRKGLEKALEYVLAGGVCSSSMDLPSEFPTTGVGGEVALDWLAPHAVGGAARLGSETAFANMDPPTPWVTWATTLWNASLNQNLLHPATAPVARLIEERVVQWISPFFGMSGGHMTPGSTLANITALWAARDCAGVSEVVASANSHLSIAKAAHILGLKYVEVPVDQQGELVVDRMPHDLSRAVLVLTAGTTSTGSIDPLKLAGQAAWTHVDAAWAGPLRFTRFASRLAGIEAADSIAVSAHKWLFQPKESALVLFRDHVKANAAISFAGGAYLAVPNVGILGSHGAMAVPLMATLMAWGLDGLAQRIERCVGNADSLANFVRTEPRLQLLADPMTAVVAWRPVDENRFSKILADLPAGTVSTTSLHGEKWFRNVAANPNIQISRVIERVRQSLDEAV